MRKALGLGTWMVCCAVSAAHSATWVRGFVVTRYEPAQYYGGSIYFHRMGAVQPGSDCPHGNLPEIDYANILRTPWRSDKEIDVINHPKNTDTFSSQFVQWQAASFRGYREDIETYLNPFAAPDPGIYEVTGGIAEGFNLDNNAKTGGFTSPTGERGIDNAYYRAFGCASSFRGPSYQAALSMRANDKMVEGLYTMVIRVSGNDSPENDPNATLEIGYSPDHIVKGAHETFLSDYSFRLLKNAEYSKVKAKVVNGAVEIAPADELHAPRFSWFPNHYGDLDLHSARLRLTPNADGNYAGLIGGYRDWRDLYTEDNFTQTGAAEEHREGQDSIGMYYALKRNADGLPDPRTGRNTGISIAYRFQALPAFIVDPASTADGTIVTPAIAHQVELFHQHQAAFAKGIATRKPQSVPAGSMEGYLGRLFRRDDGGYYIIESMEKAVQERENEARAKGVSSESLVRLIR